MTLQRLTGGICGVGVLLLGSTVPPAGVPASPAVQEARACKRCSGTGLEPCKSCKRSLCPGETPTLFCSVAAECERCGGTQRMDCKRCETGHAFDLEARRAEIEALRTRFEPIDRFMDSDELMHARSAHFDLTWGIRRISTPGAKGLHGALHVYVDRLEAFMADFQRDLSAADEDFLDRTHVMLWGSAAAQKKASLEYTRQHSDTESKLMGASPVVSIFYDKSHLHEEFELHQAVVHQVAHCLLSNVFDGIWPGNLKGGWIDEGLAHYYENAYFGEVRHYCYVESDSIQYFKFGRWEPSVRAAVDRDKAPSFLNVARHNTVEMTPEQRMFAWSFCDYLLRAHPGCMVVVAKAIKGKKPLKDVLDEGVGMNAFEFEAAWKAWVKQTYSVKKRR